MTDRDDICLGPGGCGAVVGDWIVHQEWHNQIAETAQQANHADGMTRPIGPRPGSSANGNDLKRMEQEAQEWAAELFRNE